MVATNLNFWLKRIIYVSMWSIEMLMLGCLVLWLMAMSTSNPAVRFIYGLADMLSRPVKAIFPNNKLDEIFAFQGSHIFAALLYVIAGLFLIFLVNLVLPPRLELRDSGTYHTKENKAALQP